MASNRQTNEARDTEHQEPVSLDEILAETAKVYEANALGSLRRAETDALQQHADAHPRKLSTFLKELEQCVTLNATTAAACIFALPRGGKKITGPSVRFAEIVSYAWRNNQASSVIVSTEGPAVIINGRAHDFETNRVWEVATRRIVQKKKNAREPDEDDRQLAIASGTSIALRNAILRLVPRAFLEDALTKAKHAATGKGTIEQRRGAAIEVFREMGATEAQVLKSLGRDGIADVTIDDLIYLRGLVTTIREGSLKLEDAMRPHEERAATSRGGSRSAPSDFGSTPPAETTTTTPVADGDPTDRGAP